VGAAPVGLRGGDRDGLKTGEGRNRAGQGAAARAPVGPRGGSRVAGWRWAQARGPLGQGVAWAPAADGEEAGRRCQCAR
jgi:hypothetical protein